MSDGPSNVAIPLLTVSVIFTDTRNSSSRTNMTLNTRDTGSNGFIGEAASTTATTTVIDTNTTGTAGDFTSTAPSWLWVVLAVCFVVLALTVANVCFFRKKTELTRNVPEGKENLIADQS